MSPNEPEITQDKFIGTDQPELFFGIVAPLGTPLKPFQNQLQELLEDRGYNVIKVRISELMNIFDLETEQPDASYQEFERINQLMKRGKELNQKFINKLRGILGLLTAAEINSIRNETSEEDDGNKFSGNAYIIRQIKRPSEAIWLRRIYEQAFHLVGIYSDKETRIQRLRNMGMTEDEAKELISKDAKEEVEGGQKLKKVFHLADVFMEIDDINEASEIIHSQTKRYIDLLFGKREDPLSPTKDEFGMYLARAASLRSADLSRQVGATLLSDNKEVLGTGCNEVPKTGGGQYWEDDDNDARDVVKQYDANAKIRRESLEQLLEELEIEEEITEDTLDTYSEELSHTTLMNLTEFGRSVHAEMEAILSASRIDTSVKGSTLYSTTYPCHNCAKHIINAGIDKVVYIEPYPKSKAHELHSDSLRKYDEEGPVANTENNDKVLFRPFIGVAPRKYTDLFSNKTPEGKRINNKNNRGELIMEDHGLRIRVSPLAYADKERKAAKYISRLGS